MKKSTYLFLMFVYLFVVAGWAGCGDRCSNAFCSESQDFPAEMELRIPYQVGESVSFANANGDTITLNCTSREYFEQKLSYSETLEIECCPEIFAENVRCKLSNMTGDTLRVSTDYVGQHVIGISAFLNGVKYQNGGLHYDASTLRDSIQLNGKTFYDVTTAEHGGVRDIYMFIAYDGKGIVGFIINGEEWALVE